jgi:hypothetical protein
MRIVEVIEDQPELTTAYHITTRELADEILAGGLRPHGGVAFLIVDRGDARQLRDDFFTVGTWMLAKTERTEEPLTLLKIDIRGIDIEIDRNSRRWYVSRGTIPANRITDLGEEAFERVI